MVCRMIERAATPTHPSKGVRYGPDMRYRTLGKDGPEVSVVGLGCNNFGRRVDEAGTRAVVDAALEAGLTLFDTADVYGHGQSEQFLGSALEGRRERVVLATKFGNPMGDDEELALGSPAYIRRAVRASLERLRTDWIDVYQYHRPDGVTPIEETLGALNELVDEGLVRHIGSSNFSAAQVEEADRIASEHGWGRFVSAQNEYSLLQREVEGELLPTCARLGIGVLPYFPLASGLLTGKYRRDEPPPAGTRLADRPERLTPEVFDQVEALDRYARERGVTLLHVGIGGLAAQPAVASVIAGATKPEQVRANAEAGEWTPSEVDLRELRAVLEGVAA
jgi:aryl-alcohol dehydrogenase-like predicted oxidoreductase